MSAVRERRIARMEFIKRELIKIIEKEKKDKYDNENFIAEIMFRFATSRRVVVEDLEAAKRYLRF